MWSAPSISDDQQVVVDRPGRRRVGKARDDERVIALDRDRAFGEDALIVGDGAGDHDASSASPVAGVVPFSSGMSASLLLLPRAVPAFARHRSVGAGAPRRRSSGSGTLIVPRTAPTNHPFRVTARRRAPILYPKRGSRAWVEGRQTDDQPTDRLLRDAGARAVGMARRPRGPARSGSSSRSLVATVSFAATAWIMGPRFTVDRVLDAAFAVILMALFNAIVRPVVLALAAPVSLILVGGPGPRPPGRGLPRRRATTPRASTSTGSSTALVGSFVYAIINTILTAILGDRQRRLLLRAAGPAAAGQAVDGPLGQAGPGDHPDRRARPPDPRRPDARRLGQHDGRPGPRREPQAVALGGDPAVDDVGQPGRHPPRQQRRDPGVPLVRARPPAPDGLEQPGRRDADRVAGSRTARACSRTTARASATC